VGESGVPDAYGPVGRTHRPAGPSRDDIRDRTETALGIGRPGDRTRVSGRGEDGFGEEPVQPQGSVRGVRLPCGAAQGGEFGAGGARKAMGGPEDVAESGGQLGEAVRRIGAAGGAQLGDHGDRGGGDPGQTADPRGVSGAQQLRLQHGSRPVRTGFEYGGRGVVHGLRGGALVGGGGLGLRG
jgi:hypothetical protein